MTEQNYIHLERKVKSISQLVRDDAHLPYLHPVKAWTKGLTIEDTAMDQIRGLASLPFIHKHVAIMPDVHWGYGAPIGSVIATKGAIIPAAVGVDIGCGMMAVRLTLMAEDLPDSLVGLRTLIEDAVPHGRTDNAGANDKGAWSDIPSSVRIRFLRLWTEYQEIVAKHQGAKARNTERHIGTLGTGNHFIEMCLDEEDHVWIMLHSGSRGPGNKIGTYFIEKAKQEMRRWFINLPDKDLAYLPEGSILCNDYIQAVEWAQKFALANRVEMMANILVKLHSLGKLPAFSQYEIAVNCHHNYIARENHFGSNVWVARKGAVRARTGDLGIIPGSMGAWSFIVRGKGNPDSFNSCSHGAGRIMSRTQARATFSVQDHVEATEGVECRKDESVLDETPGAYKDIDAVMAAQSDLVKIVHTLRQVICVKG